MSRCIITHPGRFHCDEVSAVALLEILFEEKATIIRTRDFETIAKMSVEETTYVVDVGEKYNVSRRLFDHHQAGMNKSFSDLEHQAKVGRNNVKIPLSSLGLVYQAYGHEIIDKYCNVQLSYKEKFDIYQTLYYAICRDIDANDNGVPFKKQGSRLNYAPNMTLVNIVGGFNSNSHSGPGQEVAFRKAVDYVIIAFISIIENVIDTFLTKKDMINNFNNYRMFLDEILNVVGAVNFKVADNILVLRKHLPMRQVIDEIDSERKWKFIIMKTDDRRWNISARSGFGRKIYVNLVDELVAKNLFDDVEYIHKAGFAGVTFSLRTALEICTLSVAGSTVAEGSKLWKPSKRYY